MFSGEEFAEFFEGAGEALFGGFFGEMEGGGDFGEGVVVVVAEEEGGAVGGGEGGEGGVEVGGEFVGVGGGWRVGECGSHGGGLLFVFLAALGGAAGVGGAEFCDFEEPGGEEFGGAEGVGAFGEEEEDGLGDVFGEVGRGLAFCGGVDEGGVARGEGVEGVGLAAGEGGEELGVGGLGHGFVHLERGGRCAGWGDGENLRFYFNGGTHGFGVSDFLGVPREARVDVGWGRRRDEQCATGIG